MRGQLSFGPNISGPLPMLMKSQSPAQFCESFGLPPIQVNRLCYFFCPFPLLDLGQRLAQLTQCSSALPVSPDSTCYSLSFLHGFHPLPLLMKSEGFPQFYQGFCSFLWYINNSS